MDKTNCPNCGAPITGMECAYCGTRLEDILRMASGKPVMISFEIGGKEYTVRFLLNSLTMRYDTDLTDLYSDGQKVLSFCNSCKTHLELAGECLPFGEDDRIFCVERSVDGQG